jgi:hypothetical protein
MSRWRRLSRKHRALSLMIAVLALAATALASTRMATSRNIDGKADGTTGLGGTLPPPADVFIQKTDAFPDLGNALVTVQLTPEQVAAKKKDGTDSYTTLGSFGEILFRDDGQGGDAVAGDGIYTGIAQVDEADLAKRAEQDQAMLKTADATIPLFAGRAVVGSQAQTAFDIAGFQGGRNVRMSLPVINVGPVGPIDPPHPHLDPLDPFQHHVLMITDSGVTGDPTRTLDPCSPDTSSLTGEGVWTFQHLMTQMSSGSGYTPADFTERWLQIWNTNQTVNSFGVPNRATEMQNILADWHDASLYTTGSALDLSQAPLRLLAIVPRLDLRQSAGPGGSFLDAGEVRFVFTFVHPPGWWRTPFVSGYGSGSCPSLPFTVIFEYKIPKTSCSAVRSWAHSWSALDGYASDPDSYKHHLELLTEQFVTHGANPGRPNGSALGQLRTNEVALADPTHWSPQDPWQLREFQLTQPVHSLLFETTTKDTPEDGFNNSTTFQSWVLGQVMPAISGTSWNQPIPSVPPAYPSSAFLGARPEVPLATGTLYWNAPGLDLTDTAQNWARFRASSATCNGCHSSSETGTHFQHIAPAIGGGVTLSGFLSGIAVNDPAHGSPSRTFGDLTRRETDIQTLAGTVCMMFPPVDIGAVSAELQRSGRIPLNPYPKIIPADQFLSVAVDDLRANHITEVH